jgi:hypothetical protein
MGERPGGLPFGLPVCPGFHWFGGRFVIVFYLVESGVANAHDLPVCGLVILEPRAA